MIVEFIFSSELARRIISTDSIQGFDSFGSATLLASSGAASGAKGLLKSAPIVHQRGYRTIDYRRIYVGVIAAELREK
jgi:hypothetical protein